MNKEVINCTSHVTKIFNKYSKTDVYRRLGSFFNPPQAAVTASNCHAPAGAPPASDSGHMARFTLCRNTSGWLSTATY